MVTAGYKKIFYDRDKLNLLINLRLFGYTFNSLSMVFHCDKTAVRQQCRKYLIEPQENPVSLAEEMSEVFPKIQQTYRMIDGERINKGKSYQEYCSPKKKTMRVYN